MSISRRLYEAVRAHIIGLGVKDILPYSAGLISILGVIFTLRFVERYLDPQVQFHIGLGLVVSLFIMGRIKAFQKPPLRLIFIVLAGFITVRYFVWRTTETLIYTGFWDLIAMTTLYMAEVYTFIIHIMGLVINAWPLEHKIIPIKGEPSNYPVVDVFVPTYTESEDIVKTTVVAALQMNYPKDKFRIHILNDGSTVARRAKPELSEEAIRRHISLKRMAEELGVGYFTRETNKSAKAGNINHALNYTDGDLVLILDCDHVPTRDLLLNTVGWFQKDEKLFLVQTPHFFINPTPVEKNVTAVSNISGENDMFYRVIHLGLNAWNSSYFCGSAAVLRRKYLMEVGGISGVSITEDAETSFLLHSRGYNSVYINRPMVCGLSPETFDDYIIQRTRWAQGMMQLMILNNPLIEKGLRMGQRLCYFNSCFFWIFGIPRFIFYIAPAAFLLLGLKVYHAAVPQIFAFALPHIFSTFVAMDFLYGKVRKPFFSEIYESVQSMFLMPAVLSVLVSPLKPTFKITPKGKKQESSYLNPMALTFFVVVILNVAILPMAVVRWINYPEFRDVITITLAWCFYNIFLAMLALGAFWETKQIRQHHRIIAIGQVEVYFIRVKQWVKADIQDMSLTGLGFAGKFPFDVKREDDIIIRAADSYGETYEFEARVQRNIFKGGVTNCGTEYKTSAANYVKAVRFVYGDSQRWLDIWELQTRPVKTSALIYRFLISGIKGTVQSVYYANKAIVLFSAKVAGSGLGIFRNYMRRLVEA
ncbi:MAG: UDP-forming cellulose synthase catalytic subunit [Deltaproteobacteria bacterium]|nr:UDP-forming cellulose synthase catalytic subunit [Deltaproteobacteria bacterium]